MKDQITEYLNSQLSVYLSSKEFAQYRIWRLQGQNEQFNNPNMSRELVEFQAQIERCNAHIERILSCIDWVQRIKLVKKESSN